MKIDFYISSLSGGGAEKVLTSLANKFAQMGNDVSIMSLEKRPQFYSVSDSVALEKVNNMGTGKLREMLADYTAIKKRLKKSDADVSISFLSRCNILVVLASIMMNKKVIVCDRNNPLKEHSKEVFERSCKIYKHASAVFVQTEKIKSFYPDYLQDKIFVLENPIDFDALQNQLCGESIEKENSIISVGRLESQKDFATLIKAFARISGIHPDWDLKIYGKGDMLSELIELACELDVSDKIKFCGRTDKPFLKLSKARIFVLSTNYEGFPNALCEGMASGLACISSDCISGPNELINHGENGYLFPVADVDTLAVQLEELINSDEKRAQFGEKARESVKRLDMNAIAEKWIDIINSI